MKNYPKPHIVRFFCAETRKVTCDGVQIEKTVKVYFKYTKAGQIGTESGFDSDKESLDIKAYLRQLSAQEQIAARALQDYSDTEVVINKRKLSLDMFMEFQKESKTYQIGAQDNYDYQGTEVKFRAREVIPVSFDLVEYRRFP